MGVGCWFVLANVRFLFFVVVVFRLAHCLWVWFSDGVCRCIRDPLNLCKPFRRFIKYFFLIKKKKGEHLFSKNAGNVYLLNRQQSLLLTMKLYLYAHKEVYSVGRNFQRNIFCKPALDVQYFIVCSQLN